MTTKPKYSKKPSKKKYSPSQNNSNVETNECARYLILHSHCSNKDACFIFQQLTANKPEESELDLELKSLGFIEPNFDDVEDLVQDED